jgi:hypothetical protein
MTGEQVAYLSGFVFLIVCLTVLFNVIDQRPVRIIKVLEELFSGTSARKRKFNHSSNPTQRRPVRGQTL